jgi:hypothetical protein
VSIFWQSVFVTFGANAILFSIFAGLQKLGAIEALTDLMVAVL